jgi:hypothetical protein
LCQKIGRAREKLGVYWGAQKIPETPLYQPGPEGIPVVDRTGEWLFLRGTKNDLAAHLRRALGGKLLDTDGNFNLRITTDEEVKRVFVGAESYEKRSKKDRDDRTTMNSLKDLIGGYDLVVIFMGFLGYKNVAVAGGLKEALLLRSAEAKPTWLMDDCATPLREGYPAYSDDLWYYIDQHFEFVDLPSVTEPEEVRENADGTADVDLNDPPDIPAPRRAPPIADPVEDDSVAGVFSGKSSKGFSGKKKPAKSSGDPMG